MRRSHPSLVLTLASIALPFWVGCSSGSHGTPGLPAGVPPAVKQAYDQGTPVPTALVAADNGLGFAAFALLRQAHPGNLLVSPMSLAQALDMAYNGAGGQTLAGMAQALGLTGVGAGQLDQDNAALLAHLYSSDPDVTLILANSIWARADILPSFLATNQTYFGAQVGTMDGAPGSVNAWVDQVTQGRIPAVLDPGLDCSQLDAILANALYFKGTWHTAFQVADTVAAPFTRMDGSQVSCTMMTQMAAGGFGRTATCDVAWLPYGGGRYRMVFLLPPPGASLASLAPDPAGWESLIQAAAAPSFQIHLPRFTAKWSASLNDTLIQLGMADAFDPLRADFPALASVAEYLAFVTQSTTVAVDEAGTVATAATAAGAAPTATGPGLNMVLDHPFIYAIQDTGTGAILFLGQLVDPTAG